jgi:hypothetical protein
MHEIIQLVVYDPIFIEVIEYKTKELFGGNTRPCKICQP